MGNLVWLFPYPQTPSPFSFILHSIHSISISYHRKRNQAQLRVHDKISIMVSSWYSLAYSLLACYFAAIMFSDNKLTIMIWSNFSTSEFLLQNELWKANNLLYGGHIFPSSLSSLISIFSFSNRLRHLLTILQLSLDLRIMTTLFSVKVIC